MLKFSESIFYLSAGAAQVWATLMVFHVLLVRDLKHQVEGEIDRLWGEAKLWWPKLLVSLRSERGLRHQLIDFGLTHEVILRADTHKDSFIRLVAAIKAHRIVIDHLSRLGPWDYEEFSPEEWQLKFEPIAERIQELELQRPGTGHAFVIGMIGIAFNLIACALASYATPFYSEFLVGMTLVSNLLLLYLFGHRVHAALEHFNLAASHRPLTEEIVELERGKSRRRRIRPKDSRSAS